MKLFGGGSPHHSNHANHPEPSGPHHAAGPAAPKPANHKPPLSKRQKRNRILILIIAVTLTLILGMCAAAAMMMRPPSIAGERKPVGSVRPDRNDATINDAENGDEMAVDEGDALDVDMGNRRAGVYTVLVAATDEDETRTDALMVATLDTVNDTVNVLNIPRDLMSSCNRTGASKKINAAYGTRGGIDTTKSEVKKVLGFTPDKYVVVSFKGIADIIDAIGGVTYEVPWRMKYDDPSQNLHINFQPGETKMDGKAAVEFMRWRKNNSGVSTGVSGTTGGDEERIEKDQKFLKFLAKEVFTVKNVPRIPSLAQAVFSNVETDLTAGEVLWLAWQLYDVKNENICMLTLPGYGTMSYAGTDTMFSFYFPYRTEVLEMVNEFMNPYEKPITNLDVVSGPSKGSGKSSSKKSKPKEEAPAEHEEPDDPEEGSASSEQAGSTDNSGESPDDITPTEPTGDSETPADPEGGPSDTDSMSPPDVPAAEPAEPEAPVEPAFPDGMFAPGSTPDPPAV